MVWTHIRTDILSVLIWVQTVSKDYQQITKVAASKEKVNLFYCYLRDSSDAGISAAAAEGVAVGVGMVEAGDF